MAAIDDIFKSIPAQVLSQFGQNITYIKTTTPRTNNPTTGAINNIMDVYPWLQSYLGAYMLGGAGTFQMRVVRG